MDIFGRRSYLHRCRLQGICLLAGIAFGAVPWAEAQWLTQSVSLKGGWNAVFLHVDASHATIDSLVGDDSGNPILQIWRWNAQSVEQYVTNPVTPTVNTEWTSWARTDTGSALQRLTGDTVYLVQVATNVTDYTWRLKGLPVLPRHAWTLTGLNLIGFSTVVGAPPKFDVFLSLAPELQSVTPEIYRYRGGELGANNPSLVPSVLFRNTPVNRGEAFWVRSGSVFNRYFGPFEVVYEGENGVDFGMDAHTATFRLRNLTSSPLTVAARLNSSETPPPGQAAIAAVPPLLLRGEKNLPYVTYGYTNLPPGVSRTWTLAPRDQPGAEVEVVLGLNRAAVTEPTNSLLAGVLSFTDSLGHSQVDMPVSARVASRAGLWVGAAKVNQVGHYLKSYVTTNDAATGEPALLTTSNGSYVVNSIDTSLGKVARSFPLRLIVHNPDDGAAVLLQQVFVGLDIATNAIVTTREANLHPAFLGNARRGSAIHLPWTANNAGWTFSGRLGQDTHLTATVTLDYSDQASNPFLHTYHPDHDNLDSTFAKTLPQGSESYTVEREITLSVGQPENDFSSLVAGADTVTGLYQETLTFKGLARQGGQADTRRFLVSGTFTLNRVSPVPVLTR